MKRLRTQARLLVARDWKLVAKVSMGIMDTTDAGPQISNYGIHNSSHCGLTPTPEVVILEVNVSSPPKLGLLILKPR